MASKLALVSVSVFVSVPVGVGIGVGIGVGVGVGFGVSVGMGAHCLRSDHHTVPLHPPLPTPPVQGTVHPCPQEGGSVDLRA